MVLRVCRRRTQPASCLRGPRLGLFSSWLYSQGRSTHPSFSRPVPPAPSRISWCPSGPGSAGRRGGPPTAGRRAGGKMASQQSSTAWASYQGRPAGSLLPQLRVPFKTHCSLAFPSLENVYFDSAAPFFSLAARSLRRSPCPVEKHAPRERRRFLLSRGRRALTPCPKTVFPSKEERKKEALCAHSASPCPHGKRSSVTKRGKQRKQSRKPARPALHSSPCHSCPATASAIRSPPPRCA